MESKDVGILFSESGLKLHRQYFNEMVRLMGIYVIYRAPKENKHYSGYGEFETYFYDPVKTGCIFDEHPTQKTMKKLGWVSELAENASLIHVPYDLPKLQVGALFIIPSGIDKAQGRVFRVVSMSTTMIYPASITCEIVPEYQNTCEPSQIHDFTHSNFNVLKEEE